MRGGKVVRFSNDDENEQLDLTVEFSELIKKVESLDEAIKDVVSELNRLTLKK